MCKHGISNSRSVQIGNKLGNLSSKEISPNQVSLQKRSISDHKGNMFDELLPTPHNGIPHTNTQSHTPTQKKKPFKNPLVDNPLRKSCIGRNLTQYKADESISDHKNMFGELLPTPRNGIPHAHTPQPKKKSPF